jgi:hypothetical protein
MAWLDLSETSYSNSSNSLSQSLLFPNQLWKPINSIGQVTKTSTRKIEGTPYRGPGLLRSVRRHRDVCRGLHLHCGETRPAALSVLQIDTLHTCVATDGLGGGALRVTERRLRVVPCIDALRSAPFHLTSILARSAPHARTGA